MFDLVDLQFLQILAMKFTNGAKIFVVIVNMATVLIDTFLILEFLSSLSANLALESSLS